MCTRVKKYNIEKSYRDGWTARTQCTAPKWNLHLVGLSLYRLHPTSVCHLPKSDSACCRLQGQYSSRSIHRMSCLSFSYHATHIACCQLLPYFPNIFEFTIQPMGTTALSSTLKKHSKIVASHKVNGKGIPG